MCNPGTGHCSGFPFSAEVEKIISVNEFVVKDALGETAHDAIKENLVLILDAEGDGFVAQRGVDVRRHVRTQGQTMIGQYRITKPISMGLTKLEVHMPQKNSLPRSQVYRCLYQLFLYPENDIRSIARDLDELEDFMEINGFSLKERTKELVAAIENNDVEGLQIEYSRLFDYKPLCFPQESAHRKDFRGNLILKQLVSLYKESGLDCSDKNAPDHISIELEFMHFLVFNEESRSDEKIEEKSMFLKYQNEFFQNHLVKWVPNFCQCIIENSESPFFCCLAHLTGEFLSSEHEYMN